jgi:hypothetical protein
MIIQMTEIEKILEFVDAAVIRGSAEGNVVK